MALSRTPYLPALLPLLLLLIHLSSASDTISANTPISGNQKLVSKGGKFALGFYQPGNSSSHRYYIAIWFNQIPQITTVWVANRAVPISDHTTSHLTISADGNLVLLNQSKSPVWSTATNTSSSTTTAVLLNSGNLVLRDASNTTLWQSIDHPTDTWLPGGKLAFNKLTGKPQRLTSWKNADDPSPGLFSLVLDPNGSSQYFIQWNETTPYWTSGTWDNGTRIFSQVPEMNRNYNYDFEYETTGQEYYFRYTLKNDSVSSRLVMDYSGQIKQLSWFDNIQSWELFWSQPKEHCQVYALCGPFGSCNQDSQTFCACVHGFRQRYPADWSLGDQSGGCVRNTPLLCDRNNRDQDRFLPMPNMGLPVNNVSLKVDAGDCEAACLSNCSCTAYSSDNGCLVWFGDLVNLQEQSSGSGSNLYLRLAASELPSSKSKKEMVVGVVGGVAVLLIALIAVVLLLVWRRRRRQMVEASKVVEGYLVPFRYSDLIRATKNFSDKLGVGGFGSVFKGTLPDSTAIAVKKLEGLHQGEKQFRSEVSTIGTIQHVNLVRLHGFCSEGANKLLVYEYMPNGSLDNQLFKGSSMVMLNWNKRHQIALGTARGLFYLHEKCRDCIIHCDIKPENILLDASFTPKVADFGMAKLVGREFSRVLTTIKGTRGYLAPEWISGLAITPKADVYSFGMMLFELISGTRNSETSEDGKIGFFPKLAAATLLEGNVLSLLDQRLGEDANLEELTRACKVACWCIQDDEYSRPTMGQVVQILEGILEIGMPPIPRSLQIYGDNEENIDFFSYSSSNQSSQTRGTTKLSQSKSTSSISSKD